MTNETAERDLLFFLGAGASVAAGVPDTFNLVKNFHKQLEREGENSALEQSKKILETLESSQLSSDGKVDVELLLEAFDQLDNLDQCIPLRFFEIKKCLIGPNISTEANLLKCELQDYIKQVGLVSKDKIKYLRSLLMFIEEEPHKPLDVFSVNYDICVEQLCNLFEKEYVDGFYLNWEPRSLGRKDVDVRLYKIHGSLIWYRTDKGGYVKLPIKSKKAEIELTTGEKASALIMYPMRKLEYTVTLMDLLMILKEKLSRVHFAFVIGYSFRDNQIRQIFWNAAKRNKELILILVSPSAHRVYEERLRKYNTGVPSELEDRVVCLPYKFEKVIHLLKNLYLKDLRAGLSQEKGCKDQENQGAPNVPWEECLLPFINCEYIDKVKQIMEKGAWEKYASRFEPSYAVRAAFKALITSVVSGDNSYQLDWLKKFNDYFFKIFDVNKLEVSVHTKERTRIVRFQFNLKGSWTCNYLRCSELTLLMKQEVSQKRLMMKEEHTSTLSKIINQLDILLNYFEQFQKGEMELAEYVKNRSKTNPSLEKLMYTTGKHGQRVLDDNVLLNVEKREFKEILKKSRISFDE